MSKKLQLTSNSWIISTKEGTSGLLFNSGTGYLYLSPTARLEFETYEDVEKKFGKMKDEERQVDEAVSHIKGFPVKHEHIEITSEEPPRYTTGGKIIFAAGYWGLRFPNGWTTAFCPKLKTTEEYQSVGPFVTKMELLNHIGMLQTQENIKASTGQ